MRQTSFTILFSATIAVTPFGTLLAANHEADFPYIYNYDANDDGVSIGLYGRLFKPANYDPTKAYPMVVFYHGQGEKGSDNTSQVQGNIDGLVAAAKARGFFVYAPQVNANSWYMSGVDASMRVLSQIRKDFNIDAQRTYATGLSMGGGGTWNAITSYKDVFAAAVPVAGVLPNAGLPAAAVLPGKPIWMFHAADDRTVNPTGSVRAMLNAIRAADGNKPALTSWRLNNSPSNPYYNTGAPYYTAGSGTTFYNENNLRYTEYQAGGHDSWTRAYADQNMYDWLLQQRADIKTLAHGRTALFDLGSQTSVPIDSNGRQWNSGVYQTETTFGTALPFALDSTGLRTSVEVNIKKKFAGRFNNANLDPTGSIYDAGIVLDGWSVGSTAGNAATIANPAIVTISGLVPGDLYKLSLFGSREGDDAGRGYITRYTINGEWRDLNTANNLTRTAIFESILANAAGQIELSVTVAPGTSRYAQLNAMELTALALVPEPTAVSALCVGGLALLARRRTAHPTGEARKPKAVLDKAQRMKGTR